MQIKFDGMNQNSDKKIPKSRLLIRGFIHTNVLLTKMLHLEVNADMSEYMYIYNISHLFNASIKEEAEQSIHIVSKNVYNPAESI